MNKTNDYDSHATQIADLLRSGLQKPNTFIERPAMYKLLPDLQNKKVLCVGCGTGEECDELTKRGAQVWGFDVSAKSVELAKEAFPDAELRVMDMHKMDYNNESFDFVYSGLTLHYTENVDEVVAEMARVLKPGGTMQFSVGHPIKWAAENRRDPKDENKKSFLLGYDTHQTPVHIYGDYLNVTKVTQKPQNYPTITYWNRPISSYLQIIRQAGLEFLDFVEPPALPEAKQVDPDFYNVHTKIPQFMIFVARKPL
ncbi:MAG TPA: methyltransferase domain-containing protein [Candidatus Saccharimonadales bacterium]|nr:methyltransferase domain-containing protein [Candidatus Saccharimonadales bacterium]